MTAIDDNTHALVALPPLAAYRADLARLGDRECLVDPDTDAAWLDLATQLGALADARRRPESAPLADSLHQRLTHRWPTPRALLDAVEQIERAGALHLALALYAEARRGWGREAAAAAALSLVHTGRASRSLGALDQAWEAYEAAELAGRRARSPEAVGRAMIGRGLIKYMRGNRPASERWFHDALEAAGTNPVVRSYAHQALCSSAVVAQEPARAIRHARDAFRSQALSADQQVDLLGLVGRVALQLGRVEPARRLQELALRLAANDRLRLSVGAALARALSRSAAHHRLPELADRIEALAATSNLPHESALALLGLSVALEEAGLGDRARGCAAQAQALARRFGFHRLEHEAEAMRSVPLHDASTTELVEAVSALDEFESLVLQGA